MGYDNLTCKEAILLPRLLSLRSFSPSSCQVFQAKINKVCSRGAPTSTSVKALDVRSLQKPDDNLPLKVSDKHIILSTQDRLLVEGESRASTSLANKHVSAEAGQAAKPVGEDRSRERGTAAFKCWLT